MKTYLYNNGTQTVAWEKNNNVYADESSYYSGAPAVITLNDDSVSVEAVLSSSGRGAKWVTSQPVDITYVSKICVNVQSVSSNSHAKGVAISRTKDGYCQGTGTLGNKTYNSSGIQEFDVSNITGEVYVSLFCMCNQTGGRSSQTVTEVYLASEYEINTTIDPVGSGSVTENWTSLEDVSLTAVPNSGFKFKKWKLNYTKLEYLQSTGTQYINTGFKPNQDTRINAYIQALSLDGWLFGSRTNFNSKAFAISSNYNGDQSRNMWNYSNGYETPSQVFSTSEFVDVDFNKNELYKNGTLVTTRTYQTFQNDFNAYLFNANLNGSLGTANPSKWKWCKIYDNGVLVRDFVPVKRSDGVLGMFDMVNLVFYTNAGTGTFTAGDEIGELEWESTTNPLSLTVYSDLDFIVYFDRSSSCYIKVNGEWKQGTLYRKDTTWKEAEIFVKNGTWKK